VRWHRNGFRLYWRSVSKRGPGRPPISLDVQELIQRLAADNPWRARRIQAELEKLGFQVGLATVSRYLPKKELGDRPRQRWRTFLRNHRDVISAMDFFVVPTVRFQLLYAWFVIQHGRREVLHVTVTAHSTAAWAIQQLREKFPRDNLIRFLIHDNDAIFSNRVVDWIEHLRIEPKATSWSCSRTSLAPSPRRLALRAPQHLRPTRGRDPAGPGPARVRRQRPRRQPHTAPGAQRSTGA